MYGKRADNFTYQLKHNTNLFGDFGEKSVKYIRFARYFGKFNAGASKELSLDLTWYNRDNA